MSIITWFLLRKFIEDPPYLVRQKGAGVKLDYVGIALLSLGIGALQTLLDKGQEDDWFSSQFITTLIITATVCLIALVTWEWFHKAPIIDVRLFKNLNFASCNLMMFMTGVMLFSSLVLMPQFLQTQVGYTAEIAGLALSAGGLVVLIEMPIIGKLTQTVEARRLISFGWLAMALSMYYSTQRIDLQISFVAATWLRVFQVVGIGFLFVPITLVAYVGVSPEKNNAVSGLVNFMRNIGSSVGTSLVTTLVARRSQFHQEILGGYIRQGNFNLQNSASNLSQHVNSSGTAAPDSLIHSYAIIYQQLQAQATTLSYIDTFMVLAVMAGIMFILSFLLKKNDPGGGGDAALG